MFEAIHNEKEYRKICDMQPKLSKLDIKYLKKYCYNDYSIELNDKLRNKEQLNKKDFEFVSYLDILISKNSLPTDIVANRFVSLDSLYYLTGIDNYIPNETIEEKVKRLKRELSNLFNLKQTNSFISCSLNNGLFYRDRLKNCFNIKAGSPCLVPGNYKEDEIILPRNATLYLKKFKIQNKSNRIYVTLYCDY